MLKVPYVDLKAQYHSIKSEIDAAVLGVLESSQFVLGPEVAALEEEFSAYCQAGYGVGVNSGTSALHLALLAAGVSPGDEVITVPFTFIATVAAILYTGARPVFVDIEPRSFNMDVGHIEAAITPRTKAVIPVHLFGQPADMDPILEVARRRGLIVIEDAAQAHGAEYKGRRVGGLGDLACFSFYPGKNLGAYGEGGMVVTNNLEHARKIKMLRDWGMEQRYHHILKGFNYRLEGIQGAILRVKLRRLEDWTRARQANAALYAKYLANLDIQTPQVMSYARHVYHVYAIRVPAGRDALPQQLMEQGIFTGVHYPLPLHLLPCYKDLGYQEGQFPEAEQAAKEVLSLPMFPELTEAQIEYVARSLAAAVER